MISLTRMSFHKWPLCVLLILTFIASTSAIKCWQCNSNLEPACEHVPTGITNVDQIKDPELRKLFSDCTTKNQTLGYKLCRKQVQTIEGKERIIRGCGIEEHTKECYSTANPMAKTYVCQCFDDGCNHSAQLILNNMLIMSSLIMSLFTIHCIVSRF